MMLVVSSLIVLLAKLAVLFSFLSGSSPFFSICHFSFNQRSSPCFCSFVLFLFFSAAYFPFAIMASCVITFFDQFLIALSTTIFLVVFQLLFFLLHSYWERFCHAVEEVFSGASDGKCSPFPSFDLRMFDTPSFSSSSPRTGRPMRA